MPSLFIYSDHLNAIMMLLCSVILDILYCAVKEGRQVGPSTIPDSNVKFYMHNEQQFANSKKNYMVTWVSFTVPVMWRIMLSSALTVSSSFLVVVLLKNLPVVSQTQQNALSHYSVLPA